jgi:hypothetical protein
MVRYADGLVVRCRPREEAEEAAEEALTRQNREATHAIGDGHHW